MGAEPLQAGELITKAGFEEPSSEPRQNLGDGDVLGVPSQCVTAGLPANTLHKLALSKYSHELANVVDRQAFSVTDFRNRDASILAGACHSDQASKPILFLCAQFHDVSS